MIVVTGLSLSVGNDTTGIVVDIRLGDKSCGLEFNFVVRKLDLKVSDWILDICNLRVPRYSVSKLIIFTGQGKNLPPFFK